VLSNSQEKTWTRSPRSSSRFPAKCCCLWANSQSCSNFTRDDHHWQSPFKAITGPELSDCAEARGGCALVLGVVSGFRVLNGNVSLCPDLRRRYQFSSIRDCLVCVTAIAFYRLCQRTWRRDYVWPGASDRWHSSRAEKCHSLDCRLFLPDRSMVAGSDRVNIAGVNG